MFLHFGISNRLLKYLQQCCCLIVIVWYRVKVSKYGDRVLDTIESTIQEYQKTDKNSSGSSNTSSDGVKRRRGSAGVDSTADDDFTDNTEQSKKRVMKTPLEIRCIDLELDGCHMGTEESNPNPKYKNSGRVLPQWSSPEIKSVSPGNNLFEEFSYKK